MDMAGRVAGVVPTVMVFEKFPQEQVLHESGCMAAQVVLNVVNVYAPNDPVDRRALWVELLTVRRSLAGLCVFVGDFNEVRDMSERLNSDFVASSAEVFNRFIDNVELCVYQMGGGSFTYVSDKGDKFSKIDSVLVCKGFMDSWPGASLNVLPKGCSDHRPLLLGMIPVDYGHIPFRFFNSWWEIPGFVDFVETCCARFRFRGPPDLALVTKFRWLKNRIKDWLEVKKKETTGLYEVNKRKIQLPEAVAVLRPLSQRELEERAECMVMVEAFEIVKQKDARQKARVKWAVDCDDNKAYFHGIFNANLSSNRLHGLMFQGSWVCNPTVVKGEVFDFFVTRFLEPVINRPVIVCPCISYLTN
ncbi:uncharacterized protein LOC143598623 [Bidens hawaiensis]|uniref:uncharacterized protein LOC143598623 n=1 Tax=Bidens hawaiensis TaxID=980011 RepID=UPI0040497999